MDYSLVSGLLGQYGDDQKGQQQWKNIDSRFKGVKDGKFRAGGMAMFTRDYEGSLNAFALKFGREAAMKAIDDIANDRLTTSQLLKLEKEILQAGREFDQMQERERHRGGLLGGMGTEYIYNNPKVTPNL